jgi:hypothetical protein
MGQDEVGTLARLKARREIIDRLIAAHRGRILNTAIPLAVLRWKVMTESPTTSGSCSATSRSTVSRTRF